MMLVWVLVLTALLASDVAGATDSLGSEETGPDREKRDIVQGPCDANWFYFAALNSCYRFFCDAKPWSDAEEICRRQPRPGHLAAVCSTGHNKFIFDVIDAVNTDTPETWIGFNDRNQEGTFTWIDGSTWGYSNWGNWEPNNAGDEDCVTVNFFDDDTWNDQGCHKKFPFVCYYRCD